MELVRLVERSGKESGFVMHAPKHAGHATQKEKDNEDQTGAQSLIELRRGLDAAQVEPGKEGGKDENPDIVGPPWEDVHCGLCAKGGTDQRIQQVIHDHAPPDNIAEDRAHLLPYIGVSRA